MPENETTNAETTATTAEAKNKAEGTSIPEKTADIEQAPKELTEDSYGDLGLPNDGEIQIDREMQSSFKKMAAEMKLSVDDAKKIAKLQYDSIQKQKEDYKNLQKEWAAQNEKTYGDNLKNVKTNAGRVLAELDKSGKFKELLDLAGAIEHPATLEFLKAIGDQLLEKPSVNPSSSAPIAEKNLEDFYN